MIYLARFHRFSHSSSNFSWATAMLCSGNCQEVTASFALMRSFYSQKCNSKVKCHQQLCFSPRPKIMSNFSTAVPFVIVLSFLGLILKRTSDVRVFPSGGYPQHDFVPSIKALSRHKNFQKTIGKTIAYC